MKKLQSVVSGLLLVSFLFQPLITDAYTKKETVYQTLDATGKVMKTVVNNHLYLEEKGDVVDDTLLKDVINSNGKEKFTKKERMLTWESKGKDIFYEGTTDIASPITVKATYYLNDEEMDAKKMIGKKGRVKVVLSFENSAYDTTKKVYTPFVVTVGGTFSAKENSHVTVTNGKVVDTGTQSLVAALASPGLYESTGIEAFSSLDEITITYETTKFKKSELYIVATPKLLSEADLAIFDEMNQFSSSFKQLGASMEEIVSGTKQLEEGSKTLHGGASEMRAHLQEALEGVSALSKGSVQLHGGLTQVTSALLDAKEKLGKVDLQTSLASLQTLQAKNREAITNLQTVNTSLENTYIKYQLANFKSDEEVVQFFASQGVDQGLIQNLLVCKKTYEGNIGMITLLSYNNQALSETTGALTTLANQASTLVTQLDAALTELTSGASTLSSGLETLEGGIKQLTDGSIQLENGVQTLESGLASLGVGVSTFNNQGIKPLVSIATELSNYQGKAKNLVQSAKAYSGYTSNNADSTIFISKLQIR